MKTFVTVIIIGVIALSIGYACRPRDYQVTATLQISYTDGTIGRMTFSGRHFGKPHSNRLFLTEGCVRFHTSYDGGHQDVVCGVRRFTVEKISSKQIE